MFKKSIYLFTAFLLGLLINISIQACGEDAETPDTANTQGSTPDPDEGYKWDVGKIAYEEEYYEDGRLEYIMENTYDKNGRLIKKVYKHPNDYSTGYTSVSTSLYSYSGNTRTITTNRKEYHPDGSFTDRGVRKTVQRLWE